MAATNLTDGQLAMLISLVGLLRGREGDYAGMCFGDILDRLWDDADVEMSPETRAICEAVREDPLLRALTFVENKVFLNDPDSHQAYLFVDASGEPIVVFEGTQGFNDVVQDAEILALESAAQAEALAYANDVYRRYRREITVVGHSLGGNLAEYVTIMSPAVCRCVAFNPLGFSSAFMLAHAPQIANAQGQITAYVQVGDNVHHWGNSVGTVVVVGGTLDDESVSGILAFHLMNGFFIYWEDEDGNLHVIESLFGLQNVTTGVYDSSYTQMPSTSEVRDFSSEKLNQLLSIINEINHRSPFDIRSWPIWKAFEHITGGFDLDKCQDNVNRYWSNVLDEHHATSQQIQAIFEAARSRDRSYSTQVIGLSGQVRTQARLMRYRAR